MDRRTFLSTGAALLLAPHALRAQSDDRARLAAWTRALREEGLARPGAPPGPAAARAGELAVGSPYVAGLLDAYAAAEGPLPPREPLTLDLGRFDCVLLVEGALAVARVAAAGPGAGWERFAREVERMRYRDGVRRGYASRLHYFSDWMADNARRGLLRELGQELGGTPDRRPLRFMSEHRGSYPALRSGAAFAHIRAMEQRLDSRPRWVVPTERVAAVQEHIRHGDVLAFATGIQGLDATHTGLAFRDGAGALRVLHAPLSGGAVEVSRHTLPEYVARLRGATGVLVARPLAGGA